MTIVLRPGDLCVFRTAPINSFSYPATGRYAALKVLAVDDRIVFAVLDGVFRDRPSFEQIAQLPILYRKRFNFKSCPAVSATPSHWDIDLLDFAVLGCVDVTSDTLALIP